jgi:type I restriction enzyme S subunit
MNLRNRIKAENYCQSVRDGTHDSPKQVESGGKPLVTTRHLKDGKIELDGTYNISDKDFDAINKRSKVDKWDILISMIGTVGELYLVKDIPNYAIKNIGLFKIGDELKAKWLYFYLKSALGQNQIKLMLQGSTQQYISLKSLRELPVPINENEIEKKNIVNFLSDLESKIELNYKLSKTLEDIAKNIFKSWFVEFDPTESIINGNTAGLTDEITNLFPDAFEDSELGKMPKGWQICSFKDLIDFKNGYAFKSKELSSKTITPYGVFKMGHIKVGGGFNQNYKTDFYTSKLTSKMNEYELKTGDILMCMTDLKNNVKLLGHTALFFEQDKKYLVNQRVGLIKHKDQISNYPYIYCLTNEVNFLKRIRKTANSGVQVNLSTNEIKNMKVICPPYKIMKLFGKISEPLFQKIFQLNKEMQTITHLRDTFITKLISGELSMKM